MSWYYSHGYTPGAPINPNHRGGWTSAPPMDWWVHPPPPHIPHPSLYNPFWPYPVPGLPPDHRVWRWLATIDGGIWEDASAISEANRAPFKSKIVGYQRVVIAEGDKEGEDPATFGLYPPAGPAVQTGVTLPSTPSSCTPQARSSPGSSQDSLEETPEVGRGYTADTDMAFQDFSDPPSPIRGNFIQVSTGTRSPSPPPLHQGQSLSPIQETVTESDEERLGKLITRGKMQYQRAREACQQSTSTPARRAVERDDPCSTRRSRSRSPAKYGKSTTPSSRSRSSSPVKGSTRRGPRNGQPRVSFTFEDSDDYDYERSTAVNSSSLNSKHCDHEISLCSPTPSLSCRRQMPDLEPIDVSVARQEARAEALRRGHIPVAMHVAQKDVSGLQQPDSSSAYSQDGTHDAGRLSVDPLRVNNRAPKTRVDTRQSIFDSYTDWKQGVSKRAPGPHPPADDKVSVFEDDYHVQKKAMDVPSRKEAVEMSKSQQAGYNREPYSPFDVMFPGIPVAGTRKVSTKTMIGDKGWLENTSPEKQPVPPKRDGFFENLRKKAKELVNMGSDQLKAPRPMNKSRQDLRERQLVISLDPREQSLLYCELEFLLCSALNSYITCQFNAGRLDTDKLKRISDGWQHRGRPKTVGFRYDLETQLDLVRMHVGDFRFYSRHATEADIYGIIDMMRVDARVMRIRTYCQPDTVISKQILDTQSLMNIIGCAEEEHIALASITRFYKDALARDKVFHYDSGETISDSARLRNADLRWHQTQEDSQVKTPQSGSRYADEPRYQSRENSSVATPHSRRSNRDRESPATPWPSADRRALLS